MLKRDAVVYRFVVAAFIVSGLGLGLMYMAPGHRGPLILGLMTPLFLFVPYVLHKNHIQIPYRLLIFFFIFLVIGYNVGFIMSGYKRFILFYCDKIVHFTSGFLFTTIGLCVFCYVRKSARANWKLGLLFALIFSMFIGLLFEFMEYATYWSFHSDPQLNLTTGVVDTMEDLLVCFVASLITVLAHYLYFSKGISRAKQPIIAEFCEQNGLPSS